MANKYGTEQDPYTYDDTGVLINKLNIHDEVLLDEAETQFNTLAAMGIEFSAPPYDFAYFCQLHKWLFDDLFEWAGKCRTIDISKDETRFCHVNRLQLEAERLFAQLESEHYLVGLPFETLVERLAQYYCDINVLHPFREGNGRTQRILFEHIVINCGYNINFSGVTAEQWLEANIQGYYCNYAPMQTLFLRCASLPK
ncbi:putative adenosine monophosphate-protein transferase Fic [Photobacterium leiognathi]|uniref:putative adenosine monophosphate-protein transferase Fic n=1 Tax=Photobacterium leiognathi TaxID=553611 RepID=UPI0029818A23|nr:putative adenosine monophosphate-protein transferase Fic [Photobacterium leiognathi]